MSRQISSAVSANQKRSRSSGSIVPSAIRKSGSNARRQYSSPTRITGTGLILAGLRQGQHLEYLIDRAVAAGEGDQRPRPQQEVQLAHREIAEAEAQIRADIGVRVLLVRQVDVEADRLRADIAGAAIGRLHDAGAAAGHDHDAAADRLVAAQADEPAELARDVIIPALGFDTTGD